MTQYDLRVAASKLIAVSSLTTGERFLIDRMRREETQAEAAQRLDIGVTKKNCFLLENDNYAFMTGLMAPAVKQLTGQEACVLLRRRAEMTQAEVAEAISRSRYWVNKMERGTESCEELIQYWGI